MKELEGELALLKYHFQPLVSKSRYLVDFKFQVLPEQIQQPYAAALSDCRNCGPSSSSSDSLVRCCPWQGRHAGLSCHL